MRKKKIKMKKKVKITIYSFILLFILSIYTLLNSSLFELKEIDLIGNIVLTKDDIIKMSSIELEKNIFKYRLSKIENEIIKNPYIKEIDIKRKFPNKLVFKINEYSEDAIIETNNKYIIINSCGKILNEKKQPDSNVPIIKNIKLEKYNLGDNIKLKDEYTQKRLLYLLECIDKNNLKKDLEFIEIEDKNIKMINKDGINILMILDENIKYNIDRLTQIIIDLKTKSIKNGTINLKNKSQAVYSPI